MVLIYVPGPPYALATLWGGKTSVKLRQNPEFVITFHLRFFWYLLTPNYLCFEILLEKKKHQPLN